MGITTPTEQHAISKRVTRKIDAADVKAIAKLVALRLTETDACAHLNIPYNAWKTFKHRKENSDEFEALLARIKSAKVKALVESIEKAGYDEKRPDWRALAWLTERVFAHQTIGRKEEVQTVQGTVKHDVSVSDALAKVYGVKQVDGGANRGEIVDAVEVKAIEEKANEKSDAETV